jgi:hypothetical protein
MAIVSGWHRLTASGRVISGPILLTGIYVNATVSGSLITLYNALDAIPGSQLLQVKAAVVGTKEVIFPNPIFCERGLYLSVGSGVTEVFLTVLPIGEG